MHNAETEFKPAATGRFPLLICLVLVAVFNLGLVYLYKQCQQREQKKELQAQV